MPSAELLDVLWGDEAPAFAVLQREAPFVQRLPTTGATGGHRGEWKKWGIYTFFMDILWIFMDIYGVELQVL